MPDTITVDGVDLLSEFGAYIFPHDIDSSPEREVDTYEVPGRHGSVLGVGSRLKNVDVSYDAVIPQDGSANLAGLRSFLMSRNGYIRIDDPADPDHYRMGMFNGPFRPVLTMDRSKAKGLIEFNCQPQRWLVSGGVEVQLPSYGSRILNPTDFDAKPIYRLVVTSGTECQLTLATDDPLFWVSIIVSNSNPYRELFIDAESMTVVGAYQVGGTITENASQYVSIATRQGTTLYAYGVDPPAIKGGGRIMYTPTYSTISNDDVHITPRWWEA